MKDNTEKLIECIKNLIRRMETIQEINPEISLDYDIKLARKTIESIKPRIERTPKTLVEIFGLDN